MQTPLTDDELKQAMRAVARVSGLALTPERIDLDLGAYKTWLSAVATVNAVALPTEAEPAAAFSLEDATSRGRQDR